MHESSLKPLAGEVLAQWHDQDQQPFHPPEYGNVLLRGTLGRPGGRNCLGRPGSLVVEGEKSMDLVYSSALKHLSP